MKSVIWRSTTNEKSTSKQRIKKFSTLVRKASFSSYGLDNTVLSTGGDCVGLICRDLHHRYGSNTVRKSPCCGWRRQVVLSASSLTAVQPGTNILKPIEVCKRFENGTNSLQIAHQYMHATLWVICGKRCKFSRRLGDIGHRRPGHFFFILEATVHGYAIKLLIIDHRQWIVSIWSLGNFNGASITGSHVIY